MCAHKPSDLIATSTVPQLAGVLGMALLRQWRFVAHDESERWLAVVAKLLDAYRREPEKFAYAVRHLTPIEGYRHWAARYDRGYNPLIESEQPVIENLIAERPAGRALDAACGTGRISALLAAHGHEVSGIDFSSAMLAIAKEKVSSAAFTTGDLAALPVTDNAFDLVTCCLALTHCVDLAPPIAELARATAHGGRVIISDIHPLNAFLGGHAGFAIADDEFAVVENRYHRLGDYLAAFSSTGLVVRQCIEPTFSATHVEKFADHFLARDTWLRDELGDHFAATARAALDGYPIALIWELEKL